MNGLTKNKNNLGHLVGMQSHTWPEYIRCSKNVLDERRVKGQLWPSANAAQVPLYGHQWLESVAAAFFPLLSTLELAVQSIDQLVDLGPVIGSIAGHCPHHLGSPACLKLFGGGCSSWRHQMAWRKACWWLWRQLKRGHH